MKKTILLLATMLISLSSFAQWTKPVPANVSEFKYSTMSAEAGDTVVYYLYNKDAGAFLNEGASSWGTQAQVTDTGLKFAIAKYTPVDEATNEATWDGKTLLLYNYSLKKGSWGMMFIDSKTQVFVDRGTQDNYFWEIESRGNGVYRIYGADINPTHNSASVVEEGHAYFGIDSNTLLEEEKVITPLIDTSDDTGAAVDWYFVTEEAYASYTEKNEIYVAAESLKKAIDKAAQYDIDTAEALKVYNNTSSTKEQLTTAANTLNGAIADKAFMDATEDNPYNATSWIVNPSFDSNNINGWDTTFEVGKNAAEVGFQNNASFTNGEATLNGFMQAWDGGTKWNANVSSRALGVGQLSQTIANMPQGKYKFTVDAIACNENTSKAADVAGVELFVLGGTVDVSDNIATARQPEHYEVTFVNTGGDITMGVRTTDKCTATWIALDNFTLTYYGKTEEDPEKIPLISAITNALKSYPLAEVDDLVAYSGDKENYKKVLDEAQSATSDFATYTEKVKSAVSALESSIDAYQKYMDQIQVVTEYTENNDNLPEVFNNVLDYIQEGNEVEPGDQFPNGSSAYIISNLSLTTEKIIAEAQYLKEIFNTAKNSGIKEGDNITNILENPSFDDGMNGWSYDQEYQNADPKSPQNIADGWNYHFNVYQTMNGVPNGIYKLKVQAFYREEQNSTSSYEHYIADPEGYESPSYIYINSTEKAINSIASQTFTEGQYEGGFESVAEGVYLPNNNAGVYSVFTEGLYDNEVIALVTDNKITVGIKSLTATGYGRWTAFDNFRLEYVGNSAEALASVIQEKADAVKEFIKEHEEDLTQPAIADAESTIEAAKKASGDDMWEAISNLDNALVPLQANLSAVEELIAACGDLGELVESNPEAESVAAPLLEKLETYPTLTTKEVKALTNEILSGMKYIALTSASASNPTDVTSYFIVNADVAGSADGWTCDYVSGETATDVGYQGSNTYTNEAAEVSIYQFLQAWGEEAALGDSQIYQIVSGLPTGTYKLTADIIACDQLSEEPVAVTGAYLQVQEAGCEAKSVDVATEDGVPVTYEITFTKASADTDVTISVYTKSSTANWLAVDNFKLYCLGADATAISTVYAGNVSSAIAIYSASGARLSILQKGVNIVKMSDNTVKKVLVK